MLELTLRVGAGDVEDILDVVLPILPGGVHVRTEGTVAELAIAAVPGTPNEEELRGIGGDRLIDLTSAEVSDDWHERRLARYEPLVIADRFLVRPEWAPAVEDPGLIEIVLIESPAFGTAIHPTTQACLTALGEAEPGGSLADYGCGSGVLSIAAAQLGWGPVVAADVNEPSIDATRANAAANGVDLEVRQLDLRTEPPPPAETIAANIPPHVQLALAGSLAESPKRVIASGFTVDDVGEIVEAWERHGLRVLDEQRVAEWSMLVME